MKKPILSLLAGLTLGSSATWLIQHNRLASASPHTTDASASFQFSPWDGKQQPTPLPLDSTSAQAAIAQWLNLPEAPRAETLNSLQTLLSRLAAPDYPALILGLLHQNHKNTAECARLAFANWTDLDAPAGAKWIVGQTTTNGIDTIDLARQAARLWADQNLTQAIHWAVTIQPQSNAEILARDLLPLLAKTDPDAALKISESLGPDFAQSIQNNLLDVLAEQDPAKAIQTFGPQLWNNGWGLNQFREPMLRWLRNDPDAAIQWIASQPVDRIQYYSNPLANLIADDGIAQVLANGILARPDFRGRQAGLHAIFERWYEMNPEAAVAWLKTVKEPHLYNQIIIGGSFGYTQLNPTLNPEGTMELDLLRPRSSNRKGAIVDHLSTWAQSDPSAALAWAETHSDPDVDRAMLRVNGAILANIATSEPQTALAEWENLPTKEAKIAAMDAIIATWGQKHPGDALQWFSAQRTSLEIPTPYYPQELVFAWGKESPEDALHWAESLGDEKARSNALKAIAGTWQEKADRSATADLYTQISDTNLRIETLTTHIKEWLTKDPDGARQWVEKANSLTPEQKTAVLSENP